MGVRPPEAERGERVSAVVDGHTRPAILAHPLYPDPVAMAGVAAADHAVGVGRQSHDGEIGPHAAVGVEKMRVHALADRRGAAHPGDRQILEQGLRIRPGDIEDGEMGQVDHAHVVGELEVLGVGHAPEMPGIPLGGAFGHAIAVGLEQMRVGGIAVRALPAGGFHEVSAEFALARPERAAAQVAPAGVGLARMNGRIVDLAGGLAGAAEHMGRRLLHRIEAGDIDVARIDRRSAVGHPIGQDLAHAGPVLDPDGLAEPEPARLRRLAQQRAAVGGNRHEPVERGLLVPAELAQDRRHLDRALVAAHHLFDIEIAHRGRHPRGLRLGDVGGLHEPRLGGFVVAPFQLAALGGGRVAGIAHIGRVALIAEQRIPDLAAGPGEGVEGPEEHQRMLERHQRQRGTGHGGQRRPPDARRQHHDVGADIAPAGLDAADPAVADVDVQRRRVAEGLQPAAGHGTLDQHAGDALGARHHQPRVRVPHRALDQVLLQQREPSLGFRRADQRHVGTEGLARADLALQLGHPRVVAHTGNLQAADPAVMAERLVELPAVDRGVARHAVVRGHVAEVGGVRGGADVRRHRRLVQPDDVRPALFDQVMGDRGADDAALADDHHIRLFG